MTSRLMKLLLPLLISLALLLASNVQAAPPQNHNGISKQQAISAAQQASPGRVLAIERDNNTYRVKMLNANGEVRIIVVDASSGELLRKR